MTSEQEGIRYRRGYKYQLAEAYSLHVSLSSNPPIRTTFVDLDETGLLTMHQHYAWDGATCAPDMRTIQRGALVHDAIYQLIYLGKLPAGEKATADNELIRICLEDGMSKTYSRVVHWFVNRYGDPRPSGMPPILSAP